MRYQHLKTTRKYRKYLLPILPIFVAGILIVSKASIPASFTNITHALATPFWTIRDTFGEKTSASKVSLQGKESLLEEVLSLREEVARLRREVVLTQTLRSDNERLRKLLDRTTVSESLVSASVIHGERFSPYDTFIIDLGAQNGVREGMLVLSPEGIAIGSVTSAQNKTATVTQFSAPNMAVDAVHNATTSFHTTLRGYGSGTMSVSIPRDIEFTIDDMFVLPAFPTYPIGNVVSIEVAPEDAYKILYVRSPVNMYELRYVLLDTLTTWEQPDLEDENPLPPEEEQPDLSETQQDTSASESAPEDPQTP
jgi:rod shape-determining protein MreC